MPRIRDGEAFDPPRANGAMEWLLAGSVVLYALQATYSTSLDKALEQTVFFYVPFALLFAVLRDVEWSPRLLRAGLGVLVVLALAFAAVGFVEYATRTLLFNPKVIASNELEEYFRVNSLFFDPNIYGRFLALVMLGLAGDPAVGAAAAHGAARRRRARGALGRPAADAVAVELRRAARGPVRARRPALPGPARCCRAILAMAIVGIVVVLAFPSALRLDLDNAESLDDATSGRYDLIRGGLDLAADRPLWGWGSGSFAEEYLEQGFGARADAVSASHTIPLTVVRSRASSGSACTSRCSQRRSRACSAGPATIPIARWWPPASSP